MLPASSLRQSLTRTFLNATTQLLLEEKKDSCGMEKKTVLCGKKSVCDDKTCLLLLICLVSL